MELFIDLLREITNPSSVIPTDEIRKDIIKSLLQNFATYTQEMDCRAWFNVCSADSHPPSTSNDRTEVINDPRIEYSCYMQVIYEKLAAFLQSARKTCDDEYTLISVQNVATISSSLQFYILSGILPYLDQGIGPSINVRSAVIKSWTLLTQNKSLQKHMLTNAMQTMMLLIRCNECLAIEIVKRHMSDLVCAAYQIQHIGGDSSQFWNYLEELESSAYRPNMISTFITLCKTNAGSLASPTWFTISIGQRLSSILQTSTGLRDTLLAYEAIGGDSFWQNYQMINHLGKHIATVPSGCKRMSYYENMVNQFIKLLNSDCIDRQHGYLRLFSVFIEYLSKKEALAGSTLILDYFFKPWEKFSSTHVPLSYNSFVVPLRILSMFLTARDCPEVIIGSPRLIELAPILLDLLSTPEIGIQCTAAIGDILEHTKSILKTLIPKVLNTGDFLFAYIGSSEQLKVIYTTKKLITYVDEDEGDIQIICDSKIGQDDVLLRRLDSVLILLHTLSKMESAKILLEVLCSSITSWNKSLSYADDLRFVTANNISDEWRRVSSHTITLFCFENFDKMDVDFTNNDLNITVLDILNILFSSITDAIEVEKSTIKLLDVHSSTNEEAVKIQELRCLSASMAVALSASVIQGGLSSDTIFHRLQELAHKICSFIRSSSDLPVFQEANKQATDVLDLMHMIGVNVAEKIPASEARVSNIRSEVNLFDCIFADLEDSQEPTRGHALIRACRAVRCKDINVIKNIEQLFDKAVDLLSDSDSYVYLAAINCIAEVSVYDSKLYLSKLLDLFSLFTFKKGNTKYDGISDKEALDDTVIIRGKLAEATGKVFLQLGDISPFWLQKASNVFLKGVHEENEIIRASCLSVFSDLLIACRGRGIEQYLDELLVIVDSMLKTEASSLVRRSSVHLIRQYIQSSNSNLFEIIGDRLRDLRRTLSWLCKWDKDHIVRLQAELCLEEIKYGIDNAISKEYSDNFRVINIK